VIQRWEIEGPWNVGEPVHESLTQQSLKAAGLIGIGDTYTSTEAWEYIRGAIWNDDPEGLLFDDQDWLRRPTTTNYSSGIEFGRNFQSGESEAAAGERMGPNEISLLKRSHFGDMQFLHGMALDGEKAAKTRANILNWAEFTYKVGTGEITGSTILKAVTVPGIRSLFPLLGNLRVDELFCIKENLRGLGDVRKRALGSLLHMIQDTYSESHTEREALGTMKRGKIRSFHSYAEQDPEKHAEKDVLEGEGALEGRIAITPGASDAVNQGARVLKMAKAGILWDQVDPAEGRSPRVVLQEIFGLADETSPAGPGVPFERPSGEAAARTERYQGPYGVPRVGSAI
jgi:hypothetical protein